MFDYYNLPSLSTTRGKLFWAGILGAMSFSLGASVMYDVAYKALRGRP